MKKIIKILIIILPLAFFSLNGVKVNAQYCTGQITCCQDYSTVCRDAATGASCRPGSPGCSCSDQCTNWDIPQNCNLGGGSCQVINGCAYAVGSCTYHPPVTPSCVSDGGCLTSGNTCCSGNSYGDATCASGSRCGTTGGGGGGSCTAGDCFTGLSNCGQVGRVNGSGSCSGGMCCALSGGGDPINCNVSITPTPVRLSSGGTQVRVTANVTGGTGTVSEVQWNIENVDPVTGYCWNTNGYNNDTVFPYETVLSTYPVKYTNGTCSPNSSGGARIRAFVLMSSGASCANSADVYVSNCNSTNPIAATLNSPADNSTISTANVDLKWTDGNSWGTGCPQNNQYKAFVSPNCTTTFTQYTGYDSVSGGIYSKNLSGLTNGTTYCWYVQKDNGSVTANTPVWKFTVNNTPVDTSHSFTQANTCSVSNQVSGRWDNPSGETENPITFQYTYEDPDGDQFWGTYLVLVPSTGAWGENSNYVDGNTLLQKSVNAKAFGALISPGNSTATLNNSYNFAPSVNSGNQTNQNGTGTIMNIGTGSNTNVSGNDITSNFKIRLENTLASGTYNVYGTVLMRNPDGSFVSAYAIPANTFRFKKLDTLTFDGVNPGSTLTGPVYNSDRTFNIAWGASDNLTLDSIYSYIWSNQASGAQLTDQTIPLVIDLSNTTLNYPSASNAGITTPSGLGTHNYKETGTNASYSYKLVSRDSACNISTTTLNVTEPSAWLMTYQGNSSAQNGFQVTVPDNPSFTVPFTSDTGTPYLSTYDLISGNIAVPSSRISKTQTYIINYINDAVNPPAQGSFTTWYELVNDRVTKNAKSRIITKGNLTINRLMSQAVGAAPNEKVVIKINGNLTVQSGQYCNIRAIYLVSGNLTITPDLTSNSSSNVCMYVVKGNITVAKSSTKTPVIDISSSSQPNYDQINAYLVTDGKLTVPTNNNPGINNKYQGLYINGGVLSQQLDLHRDLNYSANLTDPGMVINYDPTYRITFGEDLASRSYSLREVL